MVPNDVPNLMGDGPFPERMGLRGLIEYQINIVRNNPLCQPRIDFFESDRARQAIIDESYETYFENLDTACMKPQTIVTASSTV